MWMQWNHKFAYGADEDKHWYYLGEIKSLEQIQEAAEEACEEFGHEYDWSDKYRGIDYTLHDKPPPEIIKSLIDDANEKSCVLVKRAEKLSLLLEEKEVTIK